MYIFFEELLDSEAWRSPFKATSDHSGSDRSGTEKK